jgi:hypothetical protein
MRPFAAGVSLMSQPPIQRLEELFQRAADLPREEREAFLDRECPDATVRARVRALLRHHEESESLAPPPPVAAAQSRARGRAL